MSPPASHGEDAPRSRRIDVIAGIVLLAISATVFVAAWHEPIALYDPLGPGRAPMAVSALLALLSAVLLGRALAGLRIGQSAQSLILGLDGQPAEDYRLRPALAVVCFFATCAYGASIAIGLPFLWSTMAFLAGLGAALGDFKPRLTAWAVGYAIVGGVAVDLLFRRLLLVQLP